jgi:hypothetical protein
VFKRSCHKIFNFVHSAIVDFDIASMKRVSYTFYTVRFYTVNFSLQFGVLVYTAVLRSRSRTDRVILLAGAA